RVGSRTFSFDLSPVAPRPPPQGIPLSRTIAPPPSSPEGLFVLCAPGAPHPRRPPPWVCDVAEFIPAAPHLRWDALPQGAAGLGAGRVQLLGCHLAHTLLQAPLPPEIRHQARADPAVVALAARVRRWLFRDDDAPPGFAQRHLFRLQTRERLRDRARY